MLANTRQYSVNDVHCTSMGNPVSATCLISGHVSTTTLVPGHIVSSLGLFHVLLFDPKPSVPDQQNKNILNMKYLKKRLETLNKYLIEILEELKKLGKPLNKSLRFHVNDINYKYFIPKTDFSKHCNLARTRPNLE